MPTPKDFTLPNINPVPKFGPRTFSSQNQPKGRGRPRGSINKVVADLKNGLLQAAENLGRDGAGTDGLVGFLEYVGVHHTRSFCGLLGKTLPLQLNASAPVQPISQVTIVTIPSGEFLNKDQIAKFAPVHQVDHTPQQADPIGEHDVIDLIEIEPVQPAPPEESIEPAPDENPGLRIVCSLTPLDRGD